MNAPLSPDEGVRAALEAFLDQGESRDEIKCRYCGDSHAGNNCRVTGGHDFDATGGTLWEFSGEAVEALRAALSTPVPVIPMGTGDAIREALGAHIQADAYRDSFPDDDDDLASNRQSEAWWRLKAREWTPDGIDHECAEAAKARILRENGNG